MNPYLIVGAAIVLMVVAGLLSYNRFIGQQQLIHNAWSNVDTELRRRHDLIPNLVSTVRGYAAHEREALEAVISARSAAIGDHGTAAEQASSENLLVGNLRHLLAVSERYPDLKASRHFLELQRQLVTTEDRIQANRRIYNGNVRAYNERVQSVPSNLVARLCGFVGAEYFEVDAAIRDGEALSVAPSPN